VLSEEEILQSTPKHHQNVARSHFGNGNRNETIPVRILITDYLIYVTIVIKIGNLVDVVI